MPLSASRVFGGTFMSPNLMDRLWPAVFFPKTYFHCLPASAVSDSSDLLLRGAGGRPGQVDPPAGRR